MSGSLDDATETRQAPAEPEGHREPLAEGATEEVDDDAVVAETHAQLYLDKRGGVYAWWNRRSQATRR